LVVARSGSLTGDVRVARLVIQDGATFSGNVSMGPQPDAFASAREVPVATAAPEPETAPAAPAPAPVAQPPRPDGKAKGKPKR